MTEISINIKCVNADKTTVIIENTATVLQLKEKIGEALSVPASQQRLIYKGRVMKDELTLDHYSVQHEHTVHMVRSGPTPAPSTTAGSTSSTAAPISGLVPPTSAASLPASSAPNPLGNMSATGNPFAAFGGLGGLDGNTDINRMQEQLLRSPDMMQQIMNSPMMDNILNNPDLLRNMFLNNPQMQSMLDANPQIRHVLNDPTVLRQSMEMMRNPNAMREAMRNQDLAMSQIENLPGGFNALRRMFEDVQEPMMEAAANSAAGNSPTTPAPSSSNVASNSTTPTNNAIPNPWGGGNQNTNNLPTTNPFGGGMGNPFLGGGMGMNGFDGMQQDPAQMAQMMSDPMVQQMMAQMFADPTMLDQMAAMNPQLRVALQNPQIRNMMGNPALMRQLFNPDNLQAMGQLQQSMQTLQQNGLFNGGPTTNNFGRNNGNGLNFESLFAANGMNSTNPFGAALGGAQSFPPPFPAVQSTSNENPSVRFAPQLQQLQDMGFVDQSANLRALQSTNGNVNAAVERLLGGN